MMVDIISIEPPHHAIARLSPKARLRLAHPYGFSHCQQIGNPPSPLLWGEEQGEGPGCQRGTQGYV